MPRGIGGRRPHIGGLAMLTVAYWTAGAFIAGPLIGLWLKRQGEAYFDRLDGHGE